MARYLSAIVRLCWLFWLCSTANGLSFEESVQQLSKNYVRKRPFPFFKNCQFPAKFVFKISISGGNQRSFGSQSRPSRVESERIGIENPAAEFADRYAAKGMAQRRDGHEVARYLTRQTFFTPSIIAILITQ
jgi:hypothetical protein